MGYVRAGKVLSLTNYFCVPKGDRDIRMVYDAMKSGENDYLWVPAFSLPSPESFTDNLETGSWMMDMDLGAMFLNFPLRPHVGTWVTGQPLSCKFLAYKSLQGRPGHRARCWAPGQAQWL